MAKRRRFSAEFKREAVELTRRPQASVSQVAQELGVNANVLSRWRRELAKPSKAGRTPPKLGVRETGSSPRPAVAGRVQRSIRR